MQRVNDLAASDGIVLSKAQLRRLYRVAGIRYLHSKTVFRQADHEEEALVERRRAFAKKLHLKLRRGE